ncbi:hypothetical protein [Duganella sp. Root198D2]|uniref:hypothetical protein n=1 Tax=Duganella sp. Root198D2 TaxID=1736489 RepID=UPI000709E51B|nr:hypothetical protein [Duganella sp. Root198D2]KRB98277.1 hypothetical protein ASE26_25545 [Duganella sp. Root198D2]
MTTLHLLLALAIVTGVMQSSLDKAGVGRVEDTAPSKATIALVMLSIPITFVSNLGLIVVTIWSFFVLRWLPTLVVIAIAFIGFSLIWGMTIATLRRSETWASLTAVGLPLVFALRLVCAVAVFFLGFSYVHGAT